MTVLLGSTAFPKSVRLRKRPEFIKLSNSSEKIHVAGFLLVWLNNEYSIPRIGITVSKKVGCSVVRNRIKRYLREIFRHDRMLLPSVDINIIARKESASMVYSDVRREITKAFRLIGTPTCSRASRSL